jgi:thymidylate synthase (FAD)
MKIIKPSVEIFTPLDGAAILQHIERCGRVCYKSEDKITPESAEPFVRGLIKRGHESVLEHYSFTVKFVCDRGVSHEIVRHRIASYSQESTRYCNYGKDSFGKEITVISPPVNYGEDYGAWMRACQKAEEEYRFLLWRGISPQVARSVLPNSLKTELVMTANLREWRHFLRLRTSPAAHPQMREVALMLLEQVRELVPVVFEDIEP